jgi:hypothetical protein
MFDEKKLGPTVDLAPRVPSLAVLVVHDDQAWVAWYCGTDLERWFADVTSPEVWAEEITLNGSGVFVWEGRTIHYMRSTGEYDAQLEGALRPITDTEWEAFRADSPPWHEEERAALSKHEVQEESRFGQGLEERADRLEDELRDLRGFLQEAQERINTALEQA